MLTQDLRCFAAVEKAVIQEFNLPSRLEEREAMAFFVPEQTSHILNHVSAARVLLGPL